MAQTVESFRPRGEAPGSLSVTSPAAPEPPSRGAGFVRALRRWGRRLVIVLLVGAALVGAAEGLRRVRTGVWGPMPDDRNRLTGVVSANRVIVSAKGTGRLIRLTVDEGSTVERGTLLATLDSEELQAERLRQLAQMAELEVRIRQGQGVAGLEVQQNTAQTARARALLESARRDQQEAEAQLDQLRRDEDRAVQLFGQSLMSGQDVEQVATERRRVEARVKSIENQIAAAEAELALSRANEQRAGLARQDVEQVRAQLRQAQARLTQIDAQLSETEVSAPISGLVSLRVARQGEVVRAGDPIVTIVDLDDVWVRAEVEESLIGRVAVGDTLAVELPWGERRDGTVTYISPEASFATQRDVNRVKRDIRTFGIKVAVPNADRRVHSGMTAYVELPASAR